MKYAPRRQHSPRTARIRGGLRFRRKPPERRGVAIVLVVGFIAVCFGLAFALLRAQGAALQLDGNATRKFAAREAAVSGALAGIRELHDSDWGGVDTVLAASLTPDTGYTVTYTTGDDSLQVGDADYDMWPYRLKIVSRGFARDPNDPLAIATSDVEAVVEFIPEAMPDEPPIWTAARQYNVFHARTSTAELDLMFRVEGPSRFQGKVELAKDSPNESDSRNQFITDLESMRQNGQGDYRPFNSDVALTSDHTGDSNETSLPVILPKLGLSVISVPNEPTTSMPSVGTYENYRLYPGGKEYSVPTVPSTVQNMNLGPDPKANPLGIYFTSSNIRIEDNVTIRGVLIDRGDVIIDGTNIQLLANDLPSIDGGATVVQLPVLIVGDDVDLEDETSMIVDGSIATKDRFRMYETGNGTSMTMQGNFLVGQFEVDAPDDWPSSSSAWDFWLDFFEAQWVGGVPVSPSTLVEHFPAYLAGFGMDITPRFVFRPPSSPVTLHWMNAGEPLYTAVAPGAGLNWQVINWHEFP